MKQESLEMFRKRYDHMGPAFNHPRSSIMTGSIAYLRPLISNQRESLNCPFAFALSPSNNSSPIKIRHVSRHGVAKIYDFRLKWPLIWETVRERLLVAMER